MKYILRTVLFIFIVLIGTPALAQNNDGPYVTIRLLAERGTIQPGEQIQVAIEESIAPGWHTYWKNPGDSGAAPRVKWTLPEGFTTSEIEWPVPHKLPYGPLLNYGYENGVILLQKIRAPATLPDGPITLKADIDVLVCQEICIPESGTYEITFNGPNAAEENNAAYFENARRALPIPIFYPPTASPTYREENGNLVIEQSIIWSQGIENYSYIPADWGIIENTAEPEITKVGGKIIIKQKRGERALKDVSQLSGLLLRNMADGEPMNAYEFTAVPAGTSPTSPVATEVSAPGELPMNDMAETGLLHALLFAIFGGLVLNLMPCVFPVLSIKALSLVKISEKNPGLARMHGLAYTAGIILSFLAIAGILITLKAAGSQIGWGFQLQNPVMVTGLAYLLFIIGLNLSGVFDIGNHFGNVGNKLTTGNTPGHSFCTGILATLVATPCTAPFMGIALGFALVQPIHIALAVFAALGLGLALPYLALSFIPALQKILPRPGTWMETFKQLLAFPMYASAAWLVWVLSQQAGTMGVLTALMGIVLIAFGIWLLRHMPASKVGRSLIRILAILSFSAAIIMTPSGMKRPDAVQFGEPYAPEKLSTLLETNDPVFVEMTAAWCITCKVNHAVALNTTATRRLFADHNVKYLIGDWTNQDPEITKYLNGFGRNGVPIYVYYGPKDASGTRPEPVLLPQILTPGIVAGIVGGS